jgi:hypothetical protein
MCDKTFNYDYGLLFHVDTHPVVACNCPICGAFFGSAFGRIMHHFKKHKSAKLKWREELRGGSNFFLHFLFVNPGKKISQIRCITRYIQLLKKTLQKFFVFFGQKYYFYFSGSKPTKILSSAKIKFQPGGPCS